MAKKTKKRSTSSTSTVARSTVVRSTGTPAVAAGSAATKSTASYSTEFNPDYSFVKKDLKRIGMLAGSFFAILVVLSFFLR